MGKKRNSKKNGSKNFIQKLLPQVRIEVTELVDQLFKKCTKVPTTSLNSSQEWEKYIQIYELVEKIREKEKDICLPRYERQEQIEPYFAMAEESQSEDGVQVQDYGEQGFGLKVTKPLKEGDLVLSIPKESIMSEETAKKSYLGNLIKTDPILQHMGNVALSLHLLAEYVGGNSLWQPYLQLLPAQFTTTLYFSPDEVKLMKGSPLLDETIKPFQNIARQYSYFYRIFQSYPEARSWPIKDYFTFDAYRWAVSAVMTRLNLVPSKGTNGQLALIPGWDMANHEHGIFSTDFNEVLEEITCFAQRKFMEGEQFKIYYGQRSNSEFFLHSGFVYPDNPNDNLSLKLGVSKNDPLFDAKAELLSALSLSPNGTFQLVPGKMPLSPNLLCFARVFCMDKEQLEFWKNDEQKTHALRHEECDLERSVQEKAFTFLHTRVSLLMRSYSTSIEDDVKALPSLTGNVFLIRSLLLEEKKILRDASNYLRAKVSTK